MKNISVAIATYNEEENIERCLESVSDWVDEMVVVDGRSRDQTADIARKKGAKVIIVDNRKNFHLNKLKAIDHCRSKWILQLDADEVVSDALREEILALEETDKINGYWMPRKNYFLGSFLKKGGQYPDFTLRFYRRGKGRLPGKSVHEQAQVEGKSVYLKNSLLHYPYPDFSHYLKHFDLYTTILADELQEQKIALGLFSFFQYFCSKPGFWFLKTFFRHRGYKDGFAGFVFSFFSSLRFPVSYIKFWEKKVEQTEN